MLWMHLGRLVPRDMETDKGQQRIGLVFAAFLVTVEFGEAFFEIFAEG